MPNEPDPATAPDPNAAKAAPDVPAAPADSPAGPPAPPADSAAPKPGASAAAPKPPHIPKRWSPPPPVKLRARTMWLFVLAAIAAVAGLLYVIVRTVMPDAEPGPPQLGAMFEERGNNYTIHPPANWVISDPHDGANLYIKAPREQGYPPVIVVSLHIKAGGIESFLREHKGRVAYEDKTVKWISEESDSIDGCPHTVRLEYECDAPCNDKMVRVHALQYIMEDKPRFYKITCFASPEVFEKYLPKFEASARSFKRTPIRSPLPTNLRDTP